MKTVIVKKTELRRKPSVKTGSTAHVQKSGILSIPTWAIRSKLVVPNHYYEVAVILEDNDKVHSLVFRDKGTSENKDYFLCSKYKNVTLIYTTMLVRKYEIKRGKYELEEFDTPSTTGFQLIINNKENDK